jgi:hypothetical protein
MSKLCTGVLSQPVELFLLTTERKMLAVVTQTGTSNTS